MYGLEIGRILHVLGVVIWIGGVAFVTLVILPTIKNWKSANDKIELFERIERRFSLIAKITSLITGLSGFYMISKLHAWERFLHVSYWWMWAMVIVWLTFTLLIFIFEPLFLHKKMMDMAKNNPEKAFTKMKKMHTHLLWLSLLTIVGAVAGSRGWLFF